MKLYIVLPKSLEKAEASVSPECYKNEDISELMTEVRDFFNDDKIFSKKQFNEVFEWTKKQLSDLEENLYPAKWGRLVRFVFRKKNSVQIFGYDCSYVAIISIVSLIISIISVIISIIK